MGRVEGQRSDAGDNLWTDKEYLEWSSNANSLGNETTGADTKKREKQTIAKTTEAQPC